MRGRQWEQRRDFHVGKVNIIIFPDWRIRFGLRKSYTEPSVRDANREKSETQFERNAHFTGPSLWHYT